MDVRKKLAEKVTELGFSAWGTTTAAPFVEEKKILSQRLEAGLLTPGSAGNLSLRTHPQIALPGVKAIVCAAASCHFPSQQGATNLARFVRMTDYHRVLRAAMTELAEVIQAADPQAECLVSVDTGPLVERAAACRAGVGFIGKNCNLVVPATGSFVLLGAILTTFPLAPDSPSETACGDCRACLDACPTGALQAPYTLRESICLSYLTQKKGWIPREYRRYMTTSLWGCDRCQDVCPYNQVEPGGPFLWHPDRERIQLPDLAMILNWTEAAYRESLKNSALYWRGRTVLQRNVLILMGNRQQPDHLPVVMAMLQDRRPVIRGHGAWALGRYSCEQAHQALKKALREEPDNQVREEIMMALGGGVEDRGKVHG